MESVIVRFREYFSSASDSEKEVIKYVLADMDGRRGLIFMSWHMARLYQQQP